MEEAVNECYLSQVRGFEPRKPARASAPATTSAFASKLAAKMFDEHPASVRSNLEARKSLRTPSQPRLDTSGFAAPAFGSLYSPPRSLHLLFSRMR
jgi:hypothetical protein